MIEQELRLSSGVLLNNYVTKCYNECKLNKTKNCSLHENILDLKTSLLKKSVILLYFTKSKVNLLNIKIFYKNCFVLKLII